MYSSDIITTKSEKDNDNNYTLSIDTLSNHTFCCNKNMLYGIHKTRYGIQGATGTGDGNYMGYLKGLGLKAAYLPLSKKNALSAKDAQKYEGHMDLGKSWMIHITSDYSIDFKWCD